MPAPLLRSPNLTLPTPPPARPVRVAFVIDNLGRAGTESQLLALIRGLDRTRVTPSLVLLDGSAAESRALEPESCSVLRLGVRKLASPAAVRAAARLVRAWRADRPDVVQAYFLDSAYLAAPAARAAGVLRVVRVRNNLGYWLTRKHRVLGRLISPLVDVTLTNSEQGRSALAGRVAVIENGVDLDRYADFPPPFAGPAVRVGCVANLRPVKNVAGLLRAARVVCDRHPTVTFAVAGDGPDRPALEGLRAELGLQDRFTFHGSVADVPAFLRTVDVAVLPSDSEGMSNALLEYLAAGRAVVATDVGANAELTGPAGGIIVPAGDVTALAGGICGFITDPDAARRMAAAGRERVAARFGRAVLCRRFEAFYTELARNPGWLTPNYGDHEHPVVTYLRCTAGNANHSANDHT